MQKVNIAAFKRTLGEFIARVKLGEEIVLTNHDRPVAKLVPFISDDGETPVIISAQGDIAAVLSYMDDLPTSVIDPLHILEEDRQQR